MKIQVCTGKSCSERFSENILKRLKSDLEFYNLDNIKILESACMWNCKCWPTIKIWNDVEKYIEPAKASKLMMDRVKQKNNNKPKKNK